MLFKQNLCGICGAEPSGSRLLVGAVILHSRTHIVFGIPRFTGAPSGRGRSGAYRHRLILITVCLLSLRVLGPGAAFASELRNGEEVAQEQNPSGGDSVDTATENDVAQDETQAQIDSAGLPAVNGITKEGIRAQADSVAELPIDNELVQENREHTRFPLLISLGVHSGYDSNPGTASGSSGSAFTDEDLTLSYDRSRGPVDIKTLGSVAAIERFGEGTDINALLDLSLSYHASRRLNLDGHVNVIYSSEPNFASNVGPIQRAGSYFATTDTLAAAYQWARRFSTVSSYSLTLVRYENSFVAEFTDRQEHTFGEELRYDLSRNTVVVTDYRFLLVDYVNGFLDSTTNFALAGLEHSFNRTLQGQLRGGAAFRSFSQEGSQVDPEFEGSLGYALGDKSSIDLTARYGVEQPTVQNATSRNTFRSGLQFRHVFTSKISTAIGFDYEHDDNQEAATTLGNTNAAGGSFAADAYDVLVSLRYQVNRRADIDLGFEHSESNSGGQGQDYSRNRYSIGLNFTF